jgi:DNA-binding transcriptional regulator/RsmH inhibitor MraZ
MGVVDGVPSQNRVRTYRACRLDDSGRVTEAASLFEAPDDATAIARARALMGDRGRFEIWEKSRQVG